MQLVALFNFACWAVSNHSALLRELLVTTETLRMFKQLNTNLELNKNWSTGLSFKSIDSIVLALNVEQFLTIHLLPALSLHVEQFLTIHPFSENPLLTRKHPECLNN